jgi:membrane protein YdbS with pleckstrin-like domain
MQVMPAVITTEYSTGQPIISPDILIWAVGLLMVGGIVNDNISWAGNAGFLLACNAIANYVIHRTELRYRTQQEDIP